MSDTPASNSSPDAPHHVSTPDYAHDVIAQCQSRLQKEAAGVDLDSESDRRSLRGFNDALYSLLTASDVFGPWLECRTLPKVQKRLDRANRLSTSLLELRAFDEELTAEHAFKIEGIDRVRERIEQRLRRGIVKLSLAKKELASPQFHDDVVELTTRLRWAGNGDEPSLEQISIGTISDVNNELLLTAREGVAHVTTLHLMLLQLRRLRSVVDLFSSILNRDLCDPILQRLTCLYDELEPATLSSSVTIMVTRMMGDSTDSDEARALREFVSAATEHVETLFEECGNTWTNQFISRIQEDFSSLLSHSDDSKSAS